jgi:hypothetical protein
LTLDRPKADKIMKDDSISADAGSLVFHDCKHNLMLLILGDQILFKELGHAKSTLGLIALCRVVRDGKHGGGR